jgi:type I restriction enzyme, S subunit
VIGNALCLTDLPTGWDGSSLRWLSRIFAGGTPDKERLDYWASGTVPWLNSGAVNQWVINHPSAYITERGLASSSARWIPPGSVLIALAGQGKTKGMAARLEIPSTCNQSMAAVVPSRSLDYRFLHWWLAANYECLRFMAGGDARDGLNLQHIGDIQVPVPPKDTQVRIADFLDDQVSRIDEAIGLRREQIQAVSERRGLHVRRMTTLGGGTDATRTGIEWMPEIACSWSLPKVSHVFRTGSGSTPPSDDRSYYDGGIPWVNTGDVKDGDLIGTARSVSQKALDAFSTLRLYAPGALVVAMYGQGATKGRVALLRSSACVNQACCVLEASDDTMTRWAFYWLRSHKQQIVQLAVGAGQPNLSQEIIRSLRIPVPPRSTREATLRELERDESAAQSSINEMVAQVELLQERKRSLIAAALTDEFDVESASGRGV